MGFLRRSAAVLVAIALVVETAQAGAEETTAAAAQQAALFKSNTEAGQAAVAALEASREAPPPSKMTDSEKAEYAAYAKWLGTVVDRFHAALDPLLALRGRLATRGPTATQIAKMTALNAEFSAQLKTLAVEVAKHATISNVLKSKHETVKNTISNIR